RRRLVQIRFENTNHHFAHLSISSNVLLADVGCSFIRFRLLVQYLLDGDTGSGQHNDKSDFKGSRSSERADSSSLAMSDHADMFSVNVLAFFKKVGASKYVGCHLTNSSLH